MTDCEYLTITMTNRKPVRIKRDNWPVLTSGQGEPTGREYRITVRQHADGRAIVYGVYTTRWQGERDRRVGTMAGPDDLEAAIEQIICEMGAPEYVRRECLAGLPAEELDRPETIDEAAARC